MPLFGPVHLFLLAGIAVAAAVLAILCRRRVLSARPLRLVLGWGLAANELVWWAFRYSHEGIHASNLPLQLCDLTLWVTVAACLTARPRLMEFAYLVGIAGAGMAVLTPDLWSPWPSYPAIYFFVAHGGVIAACVFLVFGGIVPLRPGAVWRVFGWVAAYAAVVGAFDAIFRVNYIYLCTKPKNVSLLNWLGPWPVYLASGAAVGLLLFWLLWLLADRANRRRAGSPAY